MATFDSESAIKFVKHHQRVSPEFKTARDRARELNALIRGIEFKEYLINQIEHLESEQRAVARKKYSRSVKDLSSRILRLLDNVYSSTGGSKVYNIEDDKERDKLIDAVANVRGGQSLEKWLEKNWVRDMYHADPNGVAFTEYQAGNEELGIEEITPYPTYKSIYDIRTYKTCGQQLEVILFEPKKLDRSTQNADMRWRLVDSQTDWFIDQVGDTFIVNKDLTFKHPFGECPGLVNSDIIELGTNIRLSPLDAIIELMGELLRDQSIKTIFKFLQGMPIFWRYVMFCTTCNGRGKYENKTCSDCQGNGFHKKRDVTDSVDLPIPKGDEIQLAPDIAGYITPPIEIWQRYDDELVLLEKVARITHWGAEIDTERARTATEVVTDIQPVIIRLNDYSDIAEKMEWKFTEWIANYLFVNKEKDQRISSINYGRRFIIEAVDVILDRYEKAKKEGDNNVILDRLFSEYLMAKHKSDPVALKIALKKSEVEPYLHLTIEQVNSIFDKREAQRKALFEEWWKTLEPKDIKKDAQKLKEEYNAWFIIMEQKLQPEIKTTE